jgi:hypothetical protein
MHILQPIEHLAIDEIVLFKGCVIFKQYTPMKYKRFGIKIYKLCDSKGFTYNMSVYLGRNRKRDCHNYHNSPILSGLNTD